MQKELNQLPNLQDELDDMPIIKRKNAREVLTPAQKKDIINQFNEGARITRLAQQYAVSPSTISRVITIVREYQEKQQEKQQERQAALSRTDRE